MSHQDLSSKYFSENSTPDSEGVPTELQVESSKSTRAVGIKVIHMLLLFVVLAGFNGGAYWLYQHMPRMNKTDSKLRKSVLSWFVGRDVTEPPDQYSLETLAEHQAQIKTMEAPRMRFDGNQMRFGDDYDDYEEDY